MQHGMWARMARGGNAGRATRVRTFAVRDAVLTGWGCCTWVCEAGTSVGCVGGEVVSVQAVGQLAQAQSPRLASRPSRGRLLYFKWHPPSSSAKHSTLNRDNTLFRPAFLPLDGLLRCHRALGNNVTVTEEYSTPQPGKSQGYVRFDHRLG